MEGADVVFHRNIEVEIVAMAGGIIEDGCRGGRAVRRCEGGDPSPAGCRGIQVRSAKGSIGRGGAVGSDTRRQSIRRRPAGGLYLD